MSEDLCFLTIAESSRLIRSKKLSPLELTKAFIDRIEALDDRINSYITVTKGHALEQAQRMEAEIQRNRWRGMMHGIPFALKDVYDTAGILTTGQSKLTKYRVPKEDATVTRHLYEAGGILLGKLATHEFAIGGPSFDLPWPPARNPWALDRFTGGSSSGAGSAVAAGLTPGAMGTDTGGSVRLPAAFCGVAGMKPTFGRVSKRGVFPLSYSLDNFGPLAWTSEDCSVLLQAVAGYDPLDPCSAKVPVPDFSADLQQGVTGLKIGVVRHFYENDINASDEVIIAMNDAIEVFY